jgi:hypothetical protein
MATTNAGFDQHLVKPVQPAELLALLAQLQPSIRSDKSTSGHGAQPYTARVSRTDAAPS